MANIQLTSTLSEKKNAFPHVATTSVSIGLDSSYGCSPNSGESDTSSCRRLLKGLCQVISVPRWPIQPFVGAFLLLASFIAVCGCNAIPDVRKKQTYHNPFPQISRVAILPFRNQSEEPTLSGFRVSQAYYNELQSIPGFEVLPLGVVEGQLADFERLVLRRPMATTRDFQEFAQFMGVDAVLQGAVTDYSPYYPPRMTLKVNWYAANEGFHPIPVGYGLPWGTKEEKKIPSWIKLESERALAKEQIATQTPVPTNEAEDNLDSMRLGARSSGSSKTLVSPNQVPVSVNKTPVHIAPHVQLATHEQEDTPSIPPSLPPRTFASDSAIGQVITDDIASESDEWKSVQNYTVEEGMPADWPDPRGFVPARPSETRPPYIPQHEPIISHMKAYNGNDEDFTNALQEYFYFRDDARFGGWQSYLQRSEDFIRFCCHLHVVETLGSRGGQLESRLNLRWPTYRYER